MATQGKRKLEYVGDLDGGNASIRLYPEYSGSAFSAGSLVYLSGGYARECADDAVTIMGIALKNAVGSGTADIPVLVLTPTSLVSACVYNATSASAITAIASVGLKYPLQLDGSISYVDNTDQTTPCFVVIDVDKTTGYAVGDIYGRYICSIMTACLQTCIGA